jgi:hypothetical protein
MDIFSIFNIFITPEAGLIADTGTRILYGLGLGLVANFVYRAGLSHLSTSETIERVRQAIVFPDIVGTTADTYRIEYSNSTYQQAVIGDLLYLTLLGHNK